MPTLHDMHCHLDFIENCDEVAADALAQKTLIFANTVTPDGWHDARTRLGRYGNVALGFGMHPWWVDESTLTESIQDALDAYDPRLIGEVGLDFGPRHRHTAQRQQQVFESIALWAAARKNRVISIHSVKAARVALDILDASGALDSCTCIFHWFTGPSDQLKRAIQAGCFFSFGTRSLATKKGREYVRVIPATQLLLETDYPPQQGSVCSFAEMRAQLVHVAADIARIKGSEAIDIAAESSADILQLPFTLN